MAKLQKAPKVLITPETLLTTNPLRCTSFGNIAELEIYIGSTDKWETIAEIYSVGGLDAEDIAAFVVEVVSKQFSF